MLCALAGIEHEEIINTAAYIKSWLSVIKGNKRVLVRAAAAAQKAVDYITASQQSSAAQGFGEDTIAA